MARQWARRYSVMAWWGTRVEVYGAICRLFRNKDIDRQERQTAVSRLGILRQTWQEILADEELRESAERLLGKYALRAGDSFQLAAALVWCRGRTAKGVFLCGDERLSKAARAEGFAVVGLGK
jgi:hypothetical protein